MPEFKLKAADIVHFDRYCYTDTEGGSKNRFSTVILPSTLSQFLGSIYCCVISKSVPKDKRPCCIKLLSSDHDCLSVDSFCYFDRMDMQSRGDLSKNVQPVGELTKAEIRLGLKQIPRFLYRSNSSIPGYLRAAIMREWKQLLK